MTFATEANKTAPTKAERIAAIEAQIIKLQQRIDDIVNDVVRTPAKKVVVLPNVGDVVKFTHGRKTGGTEPRTVEGTVTGVKPSTKVGDKTTPALIKVQIGDGFDASFVTIYPAQISVTIPV